MLLKMYYCLPFVDESSPVRIADVKLPSRPLRLEKSSKTGTRSRVARAAGSRYKMSVTFWKDGRQLPCLKRWYVCLIFIFTVITLFFIEQVPVDGVFRFKTASHASCP